jgi:cephalosporin-C deacetylase-like acetyl esterase
MNARKLIYLSVMGFLMVGCPLSAELYLSGKTDKDPLDYKVGEEISFIIQVEDDGVPVEGIRLSWKFRGDDGKIKMGECVTSLNPLSFKSTLDKPGFIYFEAHVLGSVSNEIPERELEKLEFKGGAGVLPDQLEGVEEPVDFDLYWARQKEKLKQTPVDTIEIIPLPDENENVQTWDVKIESPGRMPVSGYLSKTRSSRLGNAIAQINFNGYGVSSALRHDRLAARSGRPMVVLNINAHGIENGREPEYYSDLKKGDLNHYAFDDNENSDPETSYFNGMVLRVLRALEFIKQQPEWDGETLIVNGGSQGAFQALLAAGLDQDVSLCTVSKPWCCDLGGVVLGRVQGWRPKYSEALRYYDPIYHASRITASVEIKTGLGDAVCPASGVAVLYNNIRSPKRITYIQGMTHSYVPSRGQEEVLVNP